MKVYRISRAKYIKDLSGTGAKLHGGRWNPKGTFLLYTAEHKSLAALELLVHLDKNTIPDDLKIASINLPEKGIVDFPLKKYQEILKSENALLDFKEAGKNWIDKQKSLGLRVPSILIPGEFNVLINPAHKTFKKVKVIDVENYKFDSRFFI